MTCEYDPVAERHLCGPRICRCEPTEAERAYETYRERVDGRVNPASAWQAAWNARGDRDAKIADDEERSQYDAADKCREHADDEGYDDSEEFMHNAGAGSAKQIAAEIRKQDAK